MRPDKIGEIGKIVYVRESPSSFPYCIEFNNKSRLSELWEGEIKLANSPNCKSIRIA